ncbi:MAG: nucleotidyl transferase AbiEii/AbiGii toxin family protein [Pseudomonadota bacterium]
MLDIVTHKTLLIQILKEICSDVSLGPVLGFKGGTAAFIFYDLGRFSVDLDFDLLDAEKEDLVFSRLDTILTRFGTVKERYNKRNTILFVISYDDKYQNIKVEVSKRTFNSKYTLKNYLGVSVLTMVKEDMFAHKLVAMLERQGNTNRDIYDVWFFLKNNWPINQDIIKKRTGYSFKEFIKRIIKVMDGVNNRSILNGIGELLNGKQKAWAKINLKAETIFLLKARS